jgi:hypothetical protein
MANTITGLTVSIYNALDVVSRELTGLIPSVTSDMTYDRAAVGQAVTSPVAPAATASDITPAVNPPDDGDQTIGTTTMTISKSRRVPVRWNGEERLALDNNGAQYNVILRDQFAQAMRTLANEVETDLGALYVGASRAYGTAGTTPFATAGDFTDASFLAKILKDNGAPNTGNSMVLDTTAGANLVGKQSRVDIAGQDDMLRRGVLLDTAGFAIRESAGIQTPAVGDAASYVTDTGATYTVGTTTIHVDTGTGDVLAGDIITFAGDTNKYVVATGFTGDGDNDVVIAEPGLKETLADGVAMTVVAAATRSMGFARSAIALATRIPALPKDGSGREVDMAEDRMIVTDPNSGLSFEIAMYLQYRQIQYEVSLAWGQVVTKPEHLALLLG